MNYHVTEGGETVTDNRTESLRQQLAGLDKLAPVHRLADRALWGADYRSGILDEIAAERSRQVERFGQQDHPDVDNILGHPECERDASRSEADRWKRINAHRVEYGTVAWDGILLEEVHEALSEEDPVRLREELVQVLAVGAAWIEAIDRRTET